MDSEHSATIHNQAESIDRKEIAIQNWIRRSFANAEGGSAERIFARRNRLQIANQIDCINT